MKHIIFNPSKTSYYSVCILIKNNGLNKQQIQRYYIDPLKQQGIPDDDIIVFSLEEDDNKKTPVSFINQYLDHLSGPLQALGVKTLYVTDGAYFKKLTDVKKVDPYQGYKLPCTAKGFDGMNVVLGVSHTTIFYNPEALNKLNASLGVLVSVYKGTYTEPGVIDETNLTYPSTLSDIENALNTLYAFPMIACDIETFGLRPSRAGLGSIAFATSKTSGFSFDIGMEYGLEAMARSDAIHNLLKEFFIKYTGTVLYHGITFDAKVLAYRLFKPKNYEQQLYAVGVMTKNVACTKILTYLATNNCIKNSLKLKEIAQEYCGNWAEDDIKDISKIPLPDLLTYNLKDALATFYVYEKMYPKVIEDKQLDIYNNLFLPFIPVTINTELNGMPMDMDKVRDAHHKLNAIVTKAEDKVFGSSLIQEFTKRLRYQAYLKKTLELKVKVVTENDFDHVHFKPSSNPQLQQLLFDEWGFISTKKTDTGQPAVGMDVLKSILAQLVHTHKLTESEYKV